MPSKRKTKVRQEKRKKRGGEKAKSKVNFKPLEILLSAHARTSQANILHLDQKDVKCTTCKRLCGKFQLFVSRQWPENHSTSFKTRFSAKSPEASGLIFITFETGLLRAQNICRKQLQSSSNVNQTKVYFLYSLGAEVPLPFFFIKERNAFVWGFLTCSHGDCSLQFPHKTKTFRVNNCVMISRKLVSISRKRHGSEKSFFHRLYI